jgi:hypothetical protein
MFLPGAVFVVIVALSIGIEALRKHCAARQQRRANRQRRLH